MTGREGSRRDDGRRGSDDGKSEGMTDERERTRAVSPPRPARLRTVFLFL
jgi:hypothetical protein